RAGHPNLPDLAASHGGVGVVTHLGGQVESDRKTGLTLPEQITEATIRLGRAAKAGVLPDRPGPPSVHLRVDAACERVLPGVGRLWTSVLRPVDRLERKPAIGGRLGRVVRTGLRSQTGHPLPRTRSERRRCSWDGRTRS